MTAKTSTDANIYPGLYYEDAAAAIEWLCRAFGFTKRLVVPGPDGKVAHSELSFGPGVIMVGTARADRRCASPRALGAVTQGLSVYVDDPDAHHARAKAAGAEIVEPPKDTDYGARGYMTRDPEGHLWYFGNYRPGAYWT
jgi:uncharacterized glyoxalase superfamily protein PhnB